LNGFVIDAGSCDDGPHQRTLIIIIKAESKGHNHGAQSRRNQSTTTHLLENILWLEALGDHELCEVAHDLG
jgi:hypothetical protein